MKFQLPRAANYHAVHLDQLHVLSMITGDPYYDEMALYLNNGVLTINHPQHVENN